MESLEYDVGGRLQCNPEYHPNHGKPMTEEELESQPDPSGEIHDWITRYENEKSAHDHLFKYISILQNTKFDSFIEQRKS